LGQPNIIGHNLLFVSVIAVAVLSFAFDAVRLQNYSLMWIPLNISSAAIVLVIAIPALLFKRSINPSGRNQPIFNLLFAGFCMATKNYLILVGAPFFGIEDSGVPLFRFFGGFIIGIGILVLYANVVGTRIARVNSLRELQNIENELRQFREAAFEELEDENKIAARNASLSLTPQLEALMELVKNSKNLVESADRLSKFLAQEVKPFSARLSLEATKLSSSRDSAAVPKVFEEEIRIEPSRAIRVWLAFLPIPFSFFLLSTFALPNLTPLDAAVAGIVFGICLALCKVALLRAPALSISWAFTTITLVAFISAVPSFLLIAGVPSDGNEPELLPAFLIIPAWSVLASSMAYILDLWQSEAEGKLTVRIQELARENKLYEQKAWLARHGWYLVLHGVVQPALTTASIRATSSTELTPEVAKQIESDLQRALDALKQNTPAKLELAHEIHSIQELWKGICEVDVQVSSQVFDEIENRETTCQVLNEVIKEVVSNAVRHGQASSAVINIDLDSVGDVKIVAANNGLRPLGNVIESLGSRMLDAVCVDRSLLWNEDSKLTEFKATIPLDNK
jgi:signal transduction histidine kinase